MNVNVKAEKFTSSALHLRSLAAPRRGSVSCVSYVRLQTTGIARHAHSAVQQHDLGPMRAASKAPMNHVSATNQSDEEREPPPEATVNPDNIGIDLDVSSSELLSPESRSSTSPALVPRSPRLRSSRGESMERRPVPLSKPAPAQSVAARTERAAKD